MVKDLKPPPVWSEYLNALSAFKRVFFLIPLFSCSNFWFLFVFYEILLEFPIFGIFLFLFFLSIGCLSVEDEPSFFSLPFSQEKERCMVVVL